MAYFPERVRDEVCPLLEQILVGIRGDNVAHLLAPLVLLTGLSSQVLTQATRIRHENPTL